jgi:sigma-B regulation protein RsbU (phosphoserine phosphatase)
MGMGQTPENPLSDSQRVTVTLAREGDERCHFKRVPLGARTTVGRDDQNDLCLPDAMLSRHHAEFRARDGAFYIVDLDSTNGTYVNDLRVQGERLLTDGDFVTLGGTSLVFHALPGIPGQDGDLEDGSCRGEIILDPAPYATQRVPQLGGPSDHSLGAIFQVSKGWVAPNPLSELYDKILDAILDLVPAQRAAILIMDGQPPALTTKATRTRNDARLGDIRFDIAEQAIEEREALLVRNIFEGSEVSPRVGADSGRRRSVMCAPLASSDREGDNQIWGLVYLDSRGSRTQLTERYLDVLTMLANIASTKIENARLREESLQKQRMEDDIRRAAEIQADLLPRSSPSIEGYRVCGATEPCRMVGGDYYDFEHDGDHLHIALADVAGKGPGAAMLMGALRTAVRSHWLADDLPAAAARINRTFHRNVPPDKYATFFFARLNTRNGQLRYVNAGHNRPLLVQPSGDWRRLEVGGTVLGAFPDASYDEETVVLEPGACLLVFSDGISDAWSDLDEADRNLVSLVHRRQRGEVAELRAEIFHAAKKTNDDRTLIVLERLEDRLRTAC